MLSQGLEFPKAMPQTAAFLWAIAGDMQEAPPYQPGLPLCEAAPAAFRPFFFSFVHPSRRLPQLAPVLLSPRRFCASLAMAPALCAARGFLHEFFEKEENPLLRQKFLIEKFPLMQFYFPISGFVYCPFLPDLFAAQRAPFARQGRSSGKASASGSLLLSIFF